MLSNKYIKWWYKLPQNIKEKLFSVYNNNLFKLKSFNLLTNDNIKIIFDEEIKKGFNINLNDALFVNEVNVIPKETNKIEDGVYFGSWSGNYIKLKIGLNQYELTTEKSIGSKNELVYIMVKNDIIIFKLFDN